MPPAMAQVSMPKSIVENGNIRQLMGCWDGPKVMGKAKSELMPLHPSVPTFEAGLQGAREALGEATCLY